MTYILLALAVIILPILTDLVLRTNALRNPATWITFLILIGFTLLFNSLLTGLPIVTYDATKILGVHVGTIPIEDFSYTFAAAFLPRIILTFYERR